MDGFLAKGKPVNIYTAQWVNSQTEDYMVTDTVVVDGVEYDAVFRENVDIDVTFIVSDKYGATDVRTAHDAFIAYMTDGALLLKSNYVDRILRCVCLKEYSPTTQKLKRPSGKNYIIGTITLHSLDTLAGNNDGHIDNPYPTPSGGSSPTITMDDTPTSGSSNPVKSSGIYNALQGKQNTLTFDSTPTASSTNPVTSGGVKTALDLKANQSTTYTKTEVDGLLGDVNVIETVKVNGTALVPDANKAVDVSVPTNVSDLTNDAGYATKISVINHGTSDTTFSLTPNVLHVWDTVTALTLTLATPADATIVNEYMIQFESGSTATTISLPSSIEWAESCGNLSVEASKTYQISIVNNIGLWASISNS